MTDFPHLESQARALCESRHGPGSWDAKHRKRAHYRERAAQQIAYARGIKTADALMAIFGYRRTG